MANVYRKIFPRFWRDEQIRQLDPLGKLVVMYVLTAQANRVGIFSFSIALAAEEIGISVRNFTKRFEDILDRLSWEYDGEARVVYIPTWWKYNPPDHISVLLGNLKDLEDLPATSLLPVFCNNTQYLSNGKKDLTKTFREAIGERYPGGHPPGQGGALPRGHPPSLGGSHPQAPPTQKQKQDQDQDQEQKHHQARARSDDGVREEIPNSLSQEEIHWDVKDGWVGISSQARKVWRKAYPHCDVGQQLRAMNVWLLANPNKAKRKDGEWGPFIVNWLSRQEERLRVKS